VPGHSRDKFAGGALTNYSEYIIITQGGRPRGVPNEDYVKPSERPASAMRRFTVDLRIHRRGRPKAYRSARITEWRKRSIQRYRVEHSDFGDFG